MAIFKPHLYALAAYKPPLEGRDPKRHLLLDFNERTLPVSEPVRHALIDFVESGRIQMYPSYGDTVEQLAEYTGVDPEKLMLTNGSDQGIELIFRASCRPGDEAIIPRPSFAMYEQCAAIEGTSVIAPFFTRENGFPLQEVLAAIDKKTRVICIANPNNPSGTAVTREAIADIAKAAPKSCVLVDECYYEYSGASVVDLIDTYPNIVVTRTFSKTWGLPSLRFGYLIASNENILALLSVRGPYDINQFAVVAARAALQHPDYTRDYVNEVMHSSKPLFEAYLDKNAIVYWPSCANYIWAFPDRVWDVEAALVKSGILVRPKADAQGNVGLRITMGSLEQTHALIEAFDQAIDV